MKQPQFYRGHNSVETCDHVNQSKEKTGTLYYGERALAAKTGLRFRKLSVQKISVKLLGCTVADYFLQLLTL